MYFWMWDAKAPKYNFSKFQQDVLFFQKMLSFESFLNQRAGFKNCLLIIQKQRRVEQLPVFW